MKYDYKVCISGSDYLMQWYSPQKHRNHLPYIDFYTFIPYKNLNALQINDLI